MEIEDYLARIASLQEKIGKKDMIIANNDVSLKDLNIEFGFLQKKVNNLQKYLKEKNSIIQDQEKLIEELEN